MDADAWGCGFADVDLGDARRNRRLVTSAQRMLACPRDTLPRKLGDPAALKGFYRLMQHEAVTHEAVLEPHVERTLASMRERDDVVLVLHDDTELDDHGVAALEDELGQIGTGTRHGYVVHNSLAVVAGTGEALGLVSQILHARPHVDPHESRAAARKRGDRESRLWATAVQDLGPVPDGRRWVDVCDRAADTFEFLSAERDLGRGFVVRASKNRWIHVREGDEERRVKLKSHLRSLPAAGERTIEVGAEPGRAGRRATLGVAWDRVVVPAPKHPRGEHSSEPTTVSLVRTREADPPEGVGPIAWLPIVDEEVADLDAAVRCIGYYERRWTIEEYHEVQKTGCGIENVQFTKADRLRPAIAVLSVVAVVLLRLRDLSRRPDRAETPAAEVFDEEFVLLLSAWRRGRPRTDLTVTEFAFALGRLGGHQNRRRDGPPGWLVLWRGWTQLAAMHQGARRAKHEKWVNRSLQVVESGREVTR